MTKPRLSRIVLVALALASTGCGPGRRGMQGAPTPKDWGALSLDECRAYDHTHAYYVVQRLRPAWLTGRRAGSYGMDPQNVGEAQIQVYVDGIRSSIGIDHLRAIRVQDLLGIRHLNPIDASLRFGTDHGAGAILVTTRAGESWRPR